MHIKRCMMHKFMTTRHLMHEWSYKDQKNQIKDQKEQKLNYRNPSSSKQNDFLE